MKGKMYSRRFLLEQTGIRTIVAVLILATFLVQVSAAPPADGDGEAIFQKSCASCHTIGGGPLIGPDLKDVTTIRDVDWLTRWISAPDKMLAEGDPIATDLLQEFNNVPMPNLGLSDADVAALIAYLQAPAGGSAATGAQPEVISQPEAPAPVVLLGNADSGGKLFAGEFKFENGGPACMSCHSVDSLSGLGGGSLGPNLTHVYDRYGDVGLSAALTSLPFPTMQGVFADKPLTEAEAADLKEFFYQANLSKGDSPVNTIWFAIIGVFGVMAFLIITQIIWIKRLDGVRKPLVGR